MPLANITDAALTVLDGGLEGIAAIEPDRPSADPGTFERCTAMRCPRPPLVASVLALAALALLAAGCGSGSANVASVGSSITTTRSSSSTNSSAQSAQVRFQTPLAYARCIRAHGLPNFPDPGSNGAFDKQALSPFASDPRYATASEICHRHGPVLGRGVQPSSVSVQQMMSDLLRFARCMRSNGVQNWPDPNANAEGTDSPGFPADMPGLDTQSPQVLDAIGKCQHLVPGYASAPRGTYP